MSCFVYFFSQITIKKLPLRSLYFIDRDHIFAPATTFNSFIMKKLALVLLAGISIASAQAQIQFGVKAGANFATQSGSDAVGAKTLVGFNGGVFLRLPVAPHISVQPEIMYSGQGASYDGTGGTESDHAHYLNIPILLKFSHGSGFYAETGPQFGFIMSAHAKQGGNSIDIKQYYNSADFAWAFGVGYKIPMSPVGIDFRYNVGIANVEDRSTSNTTGSVRNDVLQLGLTYVLFSTGRR
jgi:hypothetical protein